MLCYVLIILAGRWLGRGGVDDVEGHGILEEVGPLHGRVGAGNGQLRSRRSDMVVEKKKKRTRNGDCEFEAVLDYCLAIGVVAGDVMLKAWEIGGDLVGVMGTRWSCHCLLEELIDSLCLIKASSH